MSGCMINPGGSHWFKFRHFHVTCLIGICQTPVGWGGQHVILLLSASVSLSRALTSHQLLSDPRTKIFFGWNVLCSQDHLFYYFCYDLDLWAQGQTLRAFFLDDMFSTVLSKIRGGF